MKLLLKIFGVIVLLLVAIAIAVPFLISAEDIAGRVSAQVTATTGRTLSIDGEISISFFPSLSIQLESVRLSNMPSGSAPDMVSMQQLDVHIPWGALLSRELSIERFIVREPVILLETDADGNANWELVPTTGAPPEEKGARGGTALPAGFDISLSDVGIRGGSLTYIDGQAGTQQHVDELGLGIVLPSLYQPLNIDGTVRYMGETLDLDVTVTTPAAAIARDDFEISLALKSRLVTMTYDGAIADGGGTISGSLDLAGKSVKELAAWQDATIEAGPDAFNAFALAGDMVFGGDTLKLTGLSASLDALKIQGTSTLVLGDVPHISADINLGMLDVNPYLPPPAESAPAGASAPIVWNDTPIDLSALSSVSADIKLAADGLVARDIKLGENAFRLQLRDGAMTLNMSKFKAYQGSGQGTVSINAKKQPYEVGTSFKLSGIEAEPLLKDSVGFDKLRGKGQLEWKLDTSGVSQKDFVSHLKGTLGFTFTDGAVKGANVAALVRSAEAVATGNMAGVNLDRNFDNAAQTDFSEMGGTLVFAKGVGTNNDLALSSPLLRVTGSGTVNLPATTVDYGVKARLVATAEGQGSQEKAKGVGIPIRIQGPFHDVKVKVDVASAARENAVESLKNKLLDRFRQ